MEGNQPQLVFDRIQCICQGKGSLFSGVFEENSIFQNLCYTYNALMGLNIEFTYSLNNSYNNITVDNLPTILYGNNIIRKPHIPNFFKVLTGIDRELEKLDVQTKLYYEMIEKYIFSDLQMLLSYYTYLYNYDKTSMMVKVFRTFYSPLQSLTSYYNDNRISREISRLLNVFNREECLEQIKQINLKIETFLSSFGDSYYENLRDRYINSVDFAIYAAIKTQKATLSNKIKDSLEGLTIKDQTFKLLKKFENCFDDILLNKPRLKNNLWSLTAVQYEEFCPKANYIDPNFKKYPQVFENTDEENRGEMKRKIIMSGCFLGFILFSRLFR